MGSTGDRVFLGHEPLPKATFLTRGIAVTWDLGEETPVQTLPVHLAVLKMMILVDVCVCVYVTANCLMHFTFDFRNRSRHLRRQQVEVD